MQNYGPKSDFEKQLSFRMQTEKKLTWATDHCLQHRLQKAYKVWEGKETS